MSSLGKRKEHDEDDALSAQAQHGSTLFVSNLPYTATTTDLKTLFSDLAPVRSAFVVTAPGSGASKGVGYVVFAMKEDAGAAYETVAREGVSMDGRALRVEWAENKPKEKGEPIKREKKSKQGAVSGPSTTARKHDTNAIRTIVISGLPATIDTHALWKKVRKYAGAEKVDSFDSASGTAHVKFTIPAQAQDAVAKLHAHVFKGHLLSVTLQRRLAALTNHRAAKPSSSPNTSSLTTVPSRASRLIVRNLPFATTAQDLRALFLPYGPVHAADVKKGFGFVWMLSRADAARAIEGANGKKVRAGLAEEAARSKQVRKKEMREGRKKGKEGVEGKEGAVEEGGERVIAVDWALSKERWEKERGHAADAGEAGDADVDAEMEDASSSGSEASDDEQLGVHPSASDSDASADEEDLDTEQGESADGDGGTSERGKPALPPPDVGTTLFVRNVPYAATEDDLRTLFRTFGPLRYARLTLDADTGRPRGTGFVCFWKREHADEVVALSEVLRAENAPPNADAPKPATKKKNPFTLPSHTSLLAPDPSSASAARLVLHGRTLDVVRAVTRDDAARLRVEGERRREKADKRNVYLLREGVILPNTPAAAILTPADIEKRTASFNARRALLRSNPSLYVSRTRLSVRRLPLFTTERGLRRLAAHAVKAFEAELREGVREGLSTDELAEAENEMEADDEGQGDAKGSGKGKRPRKGKATRKSGAVKQAKVVRQAERVDAVTGKGRSRGYGFLELCTHADALRVLRWANNNPDVHTLLRGWWRQELGELLVREKAKSTGEGKRDEARVKRMEEEVRRFDEEAEEGAGGRKAKGTLVVEFSIENVQVVQRREGKQKEARAAKPEPKPLQKLAIQRRQSVEPPRKKRKVGRTAEPEASATVKVKEKTSSNVGLGHLIGRKRKERKKK